MGHTTWSACICTLARVSKIENVPTINFIYNYCGLFSETFCRSYAIAYFYFCTSLRAFERSITSFYALLKRENLHIKYIKIMRFFVYTNIDHYHYIHSQWRNIWQHFAHKLSLCVYTQYTNGFYFNVLIAFVFITLFGIEAMLKFGLFSKNQNIRGPWFTINNILSKMFYYLYVYRQNVSLRTLLSFS